MDFTDLINNIKERISPGSSAIHTAPGQSYGPSVSVHGGHVPIKYITTGNATGTYQTYFDREGGPFGKPTYKASPQITINPTTQDFRENYGSNVNPVIHHEVAHAILEKPRSYDGVTGATDYDTMAARNPVYEQILPKLSGRIVNTSEVPAYMSESGAAQRWNIPQNIVDVYRNNFASQLTPEARDEYVKNLGR